MLEKAFGNHSLVGASNWTTFSEEKKRKTPI